MRDTSIYTNTVETQESVPLQLGDVRERKPQGDDCGHLILLKEGEIVRNRELKEDIE